MGISLEINQESDSVSCLYVNYLRTSHLYNKKITVSSTATYRIDICSLLHSKEIEDVRPLSFLYEFEIQHQITKTTIIGSKLKNDLAINTNKILF